MCAIGASGSVEVEEDAVEQRGRVSWHVIVLVLTATVALFSRFWHPYFQGLFEDDFFYYALVAKHIALDHRSTFDGTHLTNGYHPLWMAVVTLCYAVFPGTAFFVAIQAVALVAIVVFYFGVLRCVRAMGVAANVQRLLALVLSLHALLLFRYGMEVTLALPFGIWTVAYVLGRDFRWTARQTFTYGVLACLTALSRLDSVLFVALLMMAQTLNAGVAWSERIKRIAIYCAGWFPFLLYLALNVHMFNAVLPVSGSAKQLKPLWPASVRPVAGLFLPVDRTKVAFVYLAVLVIVVGGAVFVRQLLFRRERVSGRTDAAVLAALFLFPVVHFGVLCALSDWTVWPWYYYSLCYALLAASCVLLAGVRVTGSRVAPLALSAAGLALVGYVVTYAALKQPRKLLAGVAEYAREHPGKYAMGDGAGAPAFLGRSPFIQMEGLTMDAEYLRFVRARMPLPVVLRHYGADYYVSFRGLPDGGCMMFSEPEQGGPRSPKLEGRICSPPLASAVEDGVEVDIYRASDVQPLR